MGGMTMDPVKSDGPVRVAGMLVPRWAWFAFCVLGIYGCFLTWGVLQERVATRKYMTDGHEETFSSFVVLNTIQAGIACLCAALLTLTSGHALRWPGNLAAAYYARLGLAACIGAYFGYQSLKFVTYPFVVLSKSSKLVPVMLVQTLLYRQRYPWTKYLAVTLITMGVTWFFFLQPAKADVHVHDHAWLGIALLAINLLLDGYINATEDRMFRALNITSRDLMLFMNLAQLVIMSTYLVTNPFGDNELANAVGFITRHPSALKDIVFFGLAGALGQTFVFMTVGTFGSIVLVTVTVTRKIVTMLISVIAFGHHFRPLQWVAVAIVFGGVLLETFASHFFGSSARAAPTKGAPDDAVTEVNGPKAKAQQPSSGELRHRAGAAAHIKAT